MSDLSIAITLTALAFVLLIIAIRMIIRSDKENAQFERTMESALAGNDLTPKQIAALFHAGR
jgi:predicted glycosyltransferase